MRVLAAEKTLYTIEAFLPGELPQDSIKVIQDRLLHSKHVGAVEFVSADSALADFRRHFDGEMLELVEGNPIPPFFRVKLDDESRKPSELVKLKNELMRSGTFEEVQAPVEWVEKISAWKFKLIFWPICLSILLLVTLSLIICNSVKLSLFMSRAFIRHLHSKAVKGVKMIAGNYRAALKRGKILHSHYIADYHLLLGKYSVKELARH